MPQIAADYPKGPAGTGPGVGRERACKWMEEVKEDEEGEPADRRQKQHSSSNKAPVVHQPQKTSWSQTTRTGWYTFAPVGVVWCVCQLEAPLQPSPVLLGVCWRLLWLGVLWMTLAGCVRALKWCPRPGHNQFKGASPPRTQQDIVTENRNNHYLWMSRSRSPSHNVPLALALADSLLLCVLQEPLPDPRRPYIKALLSRLESVSHTLEKADVGSEETVEKVDRESVLIDKVNLIGTYLQQRMRSLCRLVQVQGDFEASVKDMLEGLEDLWAQLEELHTGVTLTKEGGQGHRELASAQADAETLFAVLGHYRNSLQCCQAHLRDSTQLLQELTWSHTQLSNSVSSSSESVWPELLLQSNMEQFDKVQESFLSVEQQTSTFRAHLEGLGKGAQEGRAGPLAHANGARSRSASPQTSLHLHGYVQHRDSTSASTSVSSTEADTDTDKDRPLSLCERSALQFTSTIERLRKSGRRK
ncbi:uncharacterized protein si:ch211-151h10.2 isoform X1 [Etheostoma spectabile]|uniref:uncharacterized protein si:ch211-151h10.2 isoform X1 n=1 Tax=Etheostoma spectabile TaxID=54343 RepID=UPI0013AFBD5D|nr:uncharacterized protein LOC116673780 isoform X1 [Etheostoma spectabile]